MLTHSSLKEIGEMYIHQLSQGNYTAKLKKIEIPDKYDIDTLYSKEGICRMIQQWVLISNNVYEESFSYQWLLIAFS